MPRVLVVAPHATRTGSTRVLISLLAGVLPHPDLAVEVLVQSDGPLRTELESFGPVPTLGRRPDAVVVNSCLAAGALADLPTSVPSAVYVHETASVLATLDANAARGLRRAHRVLAVSDRGRADLQEFGIPRIASRCSPLVVPRPRAAPAAVAEARAAMGAADDERIVLACGEASERKGADLFVELGVHLDRGSAVRMVWLGRRLRSDARLLDHDTEATGQAGLLRWIDAVEDPDPYLAAADVVVVTSRDDPQPLVPIEAAVQGTPVVGFDVGGVADLAADGGALAVAYPDAPALAEATREVLTSAERGAGLVAGARSRLERRQSPAVILPRFEALLLDLLSGVGRSAD